MTKTGYREVLLRYHAATGLVHDIKQVANRIRQLKGLWQFIRRLQNDTVLGYRENGTIDATDQGGMTTPRYLQNCLFPV